ncbi:MAG: AICAR transformylase/IMP cyclohydrolase PurH [Candidatus Methanohalarchaeum thermophilum]|uniref:AICAR transformylase/IMP cyclohydrolase PurH n=1 Tax=Methanohalarchaeum thermophilum TaxID=1903181 RepID=A0A1Q6DSG4_METT1|nr:MAG: AICAR transformylase/IMP cyclohydrolase PurH [Candidatus Methanohalarchaeum thermophilum]
MSGIEVERGLISAADKRGLSSFCRFLSNIGVELFATSGSLGYLRDRGINANSVSELTGFNELLDGKVKTLSPELHAGILGSKDELEEINQPRFKKIDLVVVNLYDYEKKREIDIGGHALIRSAAKNYENTVVLTKSRDYLEFTNEFRKNKSISKEFSLEKAIEALEYTSEYDKKITKALKDIKEKKK